MGIHVSIQIQGSVEDVWKRTQDPALHERWDLRFSSIKYLPKESPEDPQRFLYETRLGFGLRVAGAGESIAIKEGADGSRSSSLRFWSEQRHSLIREGSGYWKYSSAPCGTAFETGYDYEPRWGWLGRRFDRTVFRPLMAWATAFSFDVLRLWVEDRATPESSIGMAVVHAICRVAIGLVWIWHGLVPKLIFHDPLEATPLLKLGVPPAFANELTSITGAAEVVLGLAVLFFWRQRLFLLLSAIAFLALGTGAIVVVPYLVGRAFGPLSLTLALLAVTLSGYVAGKELPSARHCQFSWGVKK